MRQMAMEWAQGASVTVKAVDTKIGRIRRRPPIG